MNLPTPVRRERPLRPPGKSAGVGGGTTVRRIALYSVLALVLVVVLILGLGSVMKTPADRIAIS